MSNPRLQINHTNTKGSIEEVSPQIHEEEDQQKQTDLLNQLKDLHLTKNQNLNVTKYTAENMNNPKRYPSKAEAINFFKKENLELWDDTNIEQAKQKQPDFSTILCADDNNVARIQLKMAIKDFGPTYLTVDGKQTIQAIIENNASRDEHFQLLVSDVRMPVLNGPDSIRLIQKYEKHFNIPIEQRSVMMLYTSESQEELILNFKVLSKDFNTLEKLRAKVTEIDQTIHAGEGIFKNQLRHAGIDIDKDDLNMEQFLIEGIHIEKIFMKTAKKEDFRAAIHSVNTLSDRLLQYQVAQVNKLDQAQPASGINQFGIFPAANTKVEPLCSEPVSMEKVPGLNK